MKILIVGGGGREHALAWRLRQSRSVKAIWVSPGNPGIARVATCVPARSDIAGYADLAQDLAIDLTVVGPEAPLVAGIVDEFQSRGMRIVGPTQAAARLEGSKIFAKEFFKRAEIPAARSEHASNVDQALAALKSFSLPVVVKADGLAAGKGVVVALNRFEAEAAIQKLGPNLVVEEFLEGDEVSFIGVSDGVNLIPFLPAQDHKRLSNNDTGENTGGMGAYVDKRILTEHESGVIMDRIMLPTLSRMRHEGSPFTGFLFAGLMMTADGPKVLEFNVRLGDPETQAILHNFQGDFAELLMSRPSQAASTGCSVSITLAASGYPGTPLTGDAIHGIEDAESTGATVFHAGTKMVGTQLVTNGGRVLSVTAGGATLPAAIECAYRAAGKIHFAGMHYRTDIGAKGLKRWNNQSSG